MYVPYRFYRVEPDQQQGGAVESCPRQAGPQVMEYIYLYTEST